MANFAELLEAIVSSKFEGYGLESIVVGGKRIPCARLADLGKLELVVIPKSGSAPEGFKAFSVTSTEADALDTYYDKANDAGLTIPMTAKARLEAVIRANKKRAERQRLEQDLNAHFGEYLSNNFEKVTDIDNVLQCQGAFVGLSNTVEQLTWLLKKESETVVQIAYLTQERDLVRKDEKRGKDHADYKAQSEKLSKLRSPLVKRRQDKFPKVKDSTPSAE